MGVVAVGSVRSVQRLLLEAIATTFAAETVDRCAPYRIRCDRSAVRRIHHMFKFLRPGASKEPPSQEVTAKFEQARALSRQGQLSEAASMCRAVLELQADHIDALMLSAEIAARQGDPERAIQALFERHAPTAKIWHGLLQAR